MNVLLERTLDRTAALLPSLLGPATKRLPRQIESFKLLTSRPFVTAVERTMADNGALTFAWPASPKSINLIRCLESNRMFSAGEEKEIALGYTNKLDTFAWLIIEF